MIYQIQTKKHKKMEDNETKTANGGSIYWDGIGITAEDVVRDLDKNYGKSGKYTDNSTLPRKLAELVLAAYNAGNDRWYGFYCDERTRRENAEAERDEAVGKAAEAQSKFNMLAVAVAEKMIKEG